MIGKRDMASDLAVDDQIFGGFQAAIDGGTRRNPCGAAGSAIRRHSSIMGRGRRLEAPGSNLDFLFRPAELEIEMSIPLPLAHPLGGRGRCAALDRARPADVRGGGSCSDARRAGRKRRPPVGGADSLPRVALSVAPAPQRSSCIPPRSSNSCVFMVRPQAMPASQQKGRRCWVEPLVRSGGQEL